MKKIVKHTPGVTTTIISSKWANLATSCLFWFFPKAIYRIIVVLSWIWTRIVGIEGDYDDYLTPTTTAPWSFVSCFDSPVNLSLKVYSLAICFIYPHPRLPWRVLHMFIQWQYWEPRTKRLKRFEFKRQLLASIFTI